MEIHHLREFAAIAETGSFSKAARQLHIAQPPLSRHIRQLEDELGIKLFVRTATGVQITREGALLLHQARAVLDDASALVDLAGRARAGLADTLRIAMAPGLCEVVNRIRIQLIKSVPHVTIEGTDMTSSQQYASIRRRLVDVGLLRQVPDHADIQTERLFAERFVVLVSESHLLAKKRTLKLKQLSGERLLLQDRDWAALTYDKILSMYAAAGLSPNVATREATPGNQASMLAVASGEMICLSSAGSFSSSHVAPKGLAVIPLDEPGAELHVQIAWRKGDASPVLCEFLRAARQLFHVA
ncbi:MAG TPA: LysR substrate-binding domain-containing protein, partial [Vicinamibacterales bacterium]|nr:LysR substrate-binding domain-containing protein [Vicinamibacterales bacterium]